MDFLDACRKLISIDSSPTNGTGDTAQFIKELSKGMGLGVHIESEIQRGIDEANVLCFPGEVKKNVHLMLQTHLDTMDPGSFALWEKNGKNPFHATIHNDQIYGLGVADTKLDFLCKLFAAKEFVGRTSKKDFAIVGTYGEEYTMSGAVHLIRHKTLTADRVLVSEPTNFDLVYAGKGLANIEVTIPFSKEEMEARQQHDEGEGQSTQCKMFKGKAAHSSQPQLGENAVEKLFEYMKMLPDQILILEVDGGTNYNTIPVHSLIEFDLVSLQGLTVNQKLLHIYNKVNSLKADFEKISDDRFNPSTTTLNIGMIRTYSDHLKIMGCVRWPSAVPEEAYIRWMDDLKLFCQNLGAVFRVRDHKKPFLMDKTSNFAQSCFQLIKDQQPEATMTTQPVTNEANVFHKFGLETLVFGPGQREGNSQTSEESIPIENLNKAIKIYMNIIEQFCYS